MLTLNNHQNYGTQLQMYALMRTIEKLGYSCTILNYDNSLQQLKRKSYIHIAKQYIYKILTNNGFDNRAELFQSFKDNYINLSKERYRSTNDLARDGKIYKKVICGSDQIWNPIFTGLDVNYYLPFVEKTKRISYAASIGIDNLSQDEASFMVPLIKNIPKVSVREKSAVDLLRKYNCFVQHVLDPTMLLEPLEWNCLSAKYNNISSNYLLYYDLTPKRDSLYNNAKLIAKKLGLQLVNIGVSTKDILKYGALNLFDVGPLQFLWLIENASFVVTNSYHGMLFSVNYNVPFVVGKKSYGSKPISSRIEDFLRMIKLTNRIVDDEFELTKALSIDFKEANLIINEKRRESVNWLISALSE